MTRRTRLLAALLLALLAAPSCGSRAQGPGGPNVVLVLVDTLRADRLPFYGYATDTAPFLSRWARRSVVFERAWAASSWTAPSTASLFTGLYPSQHGVTMGKEAFDRAKSRTDVKAEILLNRVPEELETLTELLRGRGYRTFGVADNPNIGALLGFDQGFERFSESNDVGSSHLLETLGDWSAEIRAARPSFVYMHFMEPHVPYVEHAPWFKDPGGDDPLARDSAAYDSEIRFLDDQIERAFEIVGVDDDTLVIFVADHGEEFGDHGGKGHEPKLYGELLHVPFFIHAPGLAPRRVPEDVSLLDVLPTLRALLDAPPSSRDAGKSLVGALEGRDSLGPRTLFAMRKAILGERQSVLSGQDKYIVLDPNDPERTPLRELYDLSLDPGEKHNLIGLRPERADELDATLREFLASSPHWRQEAVFAPTEEESQQLKELGYTGGTSDSEEPERPAHEE